MLSQKTAKLQNFLNVNKNIIETESCFNNLRMIQIPIVITSRLQLGLP